MFTLAAARPGTGPAGVVVITGASSGIGRCTAALFGRSGWSVGLIARGEPGLRAIHAELAAASVRAAAAAADVARGGELEAAAAVLERELGPIDVWINCAGNGVYGPFLSVPEEEFHRVTEVTYLGTVNGTRVALRRMLPRDAGIVVNVCSAIAFHGLPILSSYSGAKYAVRGFTESVRHELIHARSRVQLTTVYPPAVNTPFFSHAVCYLAQSPRPAKPVYQPDIVAEAILLAVRTGRHEVKVSGISIIYALACALVPGLVRLAIQRLGSVGQMTDRADVARLRDPTLFAPSNKAWGAHGPFDDESRGWSVQVWAMRHRASLAAFASGVAVAVTGLLALALHH